MPTLVIIYLSLYTLSVLLDLYPIHPGHRIGDIFPFMLIYAHTLGQLQVIKGTHGGEGWRKLLNLDKIHMDTM